MSETTDNTASASGGHHGRRPQDSAGFEETLRHFWATRPQRARYGRKIAGVAAGIGVRYGIDPIVVRVAFVVATCFGAGAGVLLYLLGWLLLPQEGDDGSAVEAMVGKGHSSMPVALTVILALALLPASGVLIGGNIGAFVAIALAAGALFLLHRHRGQGPAGTAAASASAVDSATATARSTVPESEPARGESAAQPGAARPSAHGPQDSPPDQRRPPSWDPLGAAPFAWDLPDPPKPTEPVTQPEPVPPRRRSKVTAATVGVALVVGGLGVLLAPYSGWLSPRHVLGLVLAVLGLGLVAGLFLRAGRGLIWLALPVGVVAVGLTGSGPGSGNWDGVGNRELHPVSVNDVQSVYRLTAGELNLDLSGLALDNGAPLITEVQLGAGNVRVRVPRNAHVEARCSAGVGNVNCLDHLAKGPGAAANGLADGSATSGRIILNVHVGTGSVEVVRG